MKKPPEGGLCHVLKDVVSGADETDGALRGRSPTRSAEREQRSQCAQLSHACFGRGRRKDPGRGCRRLFPTESRTRAQGGDGFLCEPRVRNSGPCHCGR